MRKDLSCESRFGLPNPTIHLWDPEGVPLVFVFVSAGTTWTRRERSCSATLGPSGLLPRGLRALSRRFTTRYPLTIYVYKKHILSADRRDDFILVSFLVHDTEGCHQIFPDHSEAGDGGEAERHQHRGSFPSLILWLRGSFPEWLIYCWDSHGHSPPVSSVACNSGAREDLPHVFQGGAGGRYQGYLEMKKTLGFGQRRMLSYAWVELHRSTFSVMIQNKTGALLR